MRIVYYTPIQLQNKHTNKSSQNLLDSLRFLKNSCIFCQLSDRKVKAVVFLAMHLLCTPLILRFSMMLSLSYLQRNDLVQISLYLTGFKKHEANLNLIKQDKTSLRALVRACGSDGMPPIHFIKRMATTCQFLGNSRNLPLILNIFLYFNSLFNDCLPII